MAGHHPAEPNHYVSSLSGICLNRIAKPTKQGEISQIVMGSQSPDRLKIINLLEVVPPTFADRKTLSAEDQCNPL